MATAFLSRKSSSDQLLPRKSCRVKFASDRPTDGAATSSAAAAGTTSAAATVPAPNRAIQNGLVRTLFRDLPEQSPSGWLLVSRFIFLSRSYAVVQKT